MSELAQQRGRVTVFGPDIRKPPLVDSAEPEMILVRDVAGDPMLLLVRVVSDDRWGLATKGDDDWEEMLVKYGIARLRADVPLADVIRNGVAPYVKAE